MVVCQQEDAFNEMPPHLWVVHHWQVNQDGTQYLSHLVLQLLDPHLEEDAYPGNSSPVMLQVHGPNVLTELLNERDNLVEVKLWANHLGDSGGSTGNLVHVGVLEVLLTFLQLLLLGSSP